MALAQRMTTFGSNHPGINFLAGLVVGTALVAAASFAAFAIQSDNQVQAIGIGGYSAAIDAELEAPRFLVSPVGHPAFSDAELQVSRVLISPFGRGALAFPDPVLEAPRITIGQLPALTPVSPIDEGAIYAERILVS